MKGLFGMIQKFGEQYTEGQVKALTKLTGLNMHREIVPLEKPEHIKRNKDIYYANKVVKKEFGVVQPVKASKPAAVKAVKAPAPVAKPALPPITGISSAIERAAASGHYGTTDPQRQALSKLAGLNIHRDLVKLPSKSPEYIKRNKDIYYTNQKVKKLFAGVANAPHEGAAVGKAVAARSELSKMFDELHAKGFQAPTPEELVKLAHDSGLHVHHLFIKATGSQLSEPQFKGLKIAHAKTIENPHVKESILHYTGSGYSNINTQLRTSSVVNGVKQLAPSVSQHVANIDHALKKSPLKEDIKLYRGISGHEIEHMFKGLKPGDIFKEPGYSSTSAFEGSSFGGTHKLVIHAAKGQHAMAIPSTIAHEKEVLLPRDSRFQVIKRVQKKSKYGYDTNTELHVQLLSPKPHPVTPPMHDPAAIIKKMVF